MAQDLHLFYDQKTRRHRVFAVVNDRYLKDVAGSTAYTTNPGDWYNVIWDVEQTSERPKTMGEAYKLAKKIHHQTGKDLIEWMHESNFDDEYGDAGEALAEYRRITAAAPNKTLSEDYYLTHFRKFWTKKANNITSRPLQALGSELGVSIESLTKEFTVGGGDLRYLNAINETLANYRAAGRIDSQELFDR